MRMQDAHARCACKMRMQDAQARCANRSPGGSLGGPRQRIARRFEFFAQDGFVAHQAFCRDRFGRDEGRSADSLTSEPISAWLQKRVAHGDVHGLFTEPNGEIDRGEFCARNQTLFLSIQSEFGSDTWNVGQ